MDKKINIADILQDKPQGTKLYSPAFGDVALDKILGNKEYCIRILDMDHSHYILTEFGQLSIHGKCMLFPSLHMQAWEKYQWKKGDVLKSIVGNNCIFDCWSNEDYTEFYAEFLTTKGNERYAKHVPRYTIQWYKEDNKQYIHEIEKYYGGNLNLKTLEIEKQQLFSALEKNGKAWDAEKKAIVDLPKKCEFKPKDWCLMREKGKTWDLCQFAYSKSTFKYNYYKAVGGTVFNECLPYNEQTAHLLGTTDDWKGCEK